MRRAFHAFLLCLMSALPAAGQDRLQLFTVGSGDVSGGYYAAAGALCAAVNRAAPGRLRCSPEPTTGSLYNLAMLKAGELDFGFVQSDWHRAAVEEGGTGLRSVMALHQEMITIIARREENIRNSRDLVGRRIDIGQPGSGRNASLNRVLAELGLGRADFEALVELPSARAFDELCAGRIDATLAIVGHPNAAVAEMLARCDAVLVPFSGDVQLVEALGLQRAVIPAGTYPGLERDVPTHAVIATVMTRADVDPRIVRSFVGAVLEDLPELRLRAAVLTGLDPGLMHDRGLVAPLHPGAEEAFAAFGE